MSAIKYGKYVPGELDDLSLEDLLNKLSDFLLQSGFHDAYGFYEMTGEQSLEELHNAILQALMDTDLFSQEMLQQMLEDSEAYQDSPLKQMIDRLIERMEREGYLSVDREGSERRNPRDRSSQGGWTGPDSASASARFEITDKAIDFLGFKTLRDLLGSLGKSSFGRHDTRDLSTGIETSGASKPYEFGDTMNLDISATLLSALSRNGLGVPIDLDYQDLAVHQSEYQSSCATVLMLDCSHSMILYGEDRFTPAKKVALALSHLIRTQYPGDSLNLVLFHDSAEEVPLSQLARVQVGPYYTNTREGLRLAQRILDRQRKDMKQIVMITDGKPSALTQGDGRIYKNAFGLDPLVLSETFKEVASCKKAGIMINTFMLARDHDLVNFVKKVTEMCRGKAYFTTPFTLGQYLLMDFMQKKTKTIH
ncbi:MAG: VWA domain-containing protein [Acidobacteriia bacterium]|nr:VWA domain-containing protein [Terriglobia bacterium]